MNELFVLVFGDSVQGTVLYGPFKTPGEIDDANRQLALPFYTVEPINIKETNQELTEKFLKSEELYTLAVGNPFESMELIGLYSTKELAYDAASSKDSDWYIVPLKSLEKVLEEIKQSSGLPANY